VEPPLFLQLIPTVFSFFMPCPAIKVQGNKKPKKRTNMLRGFILRLEAKYLRLICKVYFLSNP
jgi:hypothetical protein